MNFRTHRRWPVVAVGVASILFGAPAVATATGDTAAASGRPATSASETLIVASSSAPSSMDAAHDDNGTGIWEAVLPYASLIDVSPTGQYIPGLATSWHYIGTGNTRFELTIRSGVKFSDGEAVTPQAVAESLNYFKKGSGPPSTADFAGVVATVSGPHSVLLTSKTPDPDFPNLLSPTELAGDIICPAAIKDPKALASTPCGAGPYVLDTKATVPDEEYTFTPDVNYYAPGQIHYNQVVVKVISDVTSQLDALKTGQIDYMPYGDSSLVGSAQAGGLKVYNYYGSGWVGVFLLDRNGKGVPALASVQVRQALNYAINRAAIAKAVWGNYAKPNDEPTVPGTDSYNASLANYYTYDVAKAKQLLAEAGYPHGFTMTLTYPAYEAQTSDMAQAIASEWSAIGVHATLVPSPDEAAATTDLVDAKNSAMAFSWGAQTMSTEVGEVWLPTSIVNPFHVAPASFLSLFTKVSGEPSATIASGWHQLEAIVVKDAYTVPAVQSASVEFASPSVMGLPKTGSAVPLAYFPLLSLHG